MSVTTIFQTSTKIIESGKEALRHAPLMVQKPQVALLWLKTARSAQISLLAIMLIMPALVPNIITSAWNTVSPPEQPRGAISRISNFFDRMQGSSTTAEHQSDERKATVQTILWSGSALLVIALLCLHIPNAVQAATGIAAEKEREADERLGRQSKESVLLYQSALEFCTLPEQIQRLQGKLLALKSESAETTGLLTSETKVNGVSEQQLQNTAYVSPETELYSDSSSLSTRYRVNKLLGKGAMGYVYLAYDTVLDRNVAIKQLSPQLCDDEQFIGRFKQEAKALAKLSHPNIVQVYDLVEDAENTWIVMEFVEGDELAKRFTPGKPLEFKFALDVAKQISQALEYAHSQGVVHRDFKPENVMLTPENKVKIMDFGLARYTHSSGLTQVGTIMGSPAYMSPEQASGKEVDYRTDIYAFGVTMYVMFSGVMPFYGDMQSVIAQHLTAEPLPPKKHNKLLPKAVERVILNMLEKTPENRPGSMQEIYKSLLSVATKKSA